jgi:hypothetical protein
MRSLRYDGSISNYMSRIEEYNSRVGMSGTTFRNMIITAMTPRVIDMIYSRAGDIPDDDDELVSIVKKAGKAVEESDQVKNLIQRRDPKPANKTKETPPIPEQDEAHRTDWPRQETRKRTANERTTDWHALFMEKPHGSLRRRTTKRD